MVKKTDEKKTTKKAATKKTTTKKESTTGANKQETCATSCMPDNCNLTTKIILIMLGVIMIMQSIVLSSISSHKNSPANLMAELQMSQFGEDAEDTVKALIDLNKEYQDVTQAQFGDEGIVEGIRAQLEQQRAMLSNTQPQFDLGDIEFEQAPDDAREDMNTEPTSDEEQNTEE